MNVFKSYNWWIDLIGIHKRNIQNALNLPHIKIFIFDFEMGVN